MDESHQGADVAFAATGGLLSSADIISRATRPVYHAPMIMTKTT